MANFILAEVIDNQPSAVYQGSVFTRKLTIKHKSGIILNVFDGDCISTNLVAQHYEFVLEPSIFKNCMIADPKTEPQIQFEGGKGILRGRVVSTNQKFAEDCCQVFEHDFMEQEWIQVTTPLGDVVLHPKEFTKFKFEVQVGDFIQCDYLRLDILAVL